MNDPDLNLEFCCTCLKVGAVGDKFVSLSFAPPEDISYTNKLRSCVPEMGLENTDDCFLCKPCSAALETAYTFRCMCLRTESRLDEFRMAQNKNSGITDKNIKQELIESCCAVEEESVKSQQHSTGFTVQPEERCSSLVVAPTHFEYPAGGSTQPTELYQTMSNSEQSDEHEVHSPGISVEFDEETTGRDSKIEIVKDELGSLLTESLEGAIDINIHIFNENSTHLRTINSKVDICNSLDAEIKQLTNASYSKPQNKLLLEEHKQLNSPEDIKENIKTLTNSLPGPLPQKKRLSDSEIIEICCKTIPDLHNCPPASLDCQVTLEKVKVSKLPVKIPKQRKATTVKSKPKPKQGKPFWCITCNKDVYRRDRFNAHILRHSNIRAYKCSICKQGFFSGETLNKHKKACTGPSQNITTMSDNTNVLAQSNTVNAPGGSNMVNVPGISNTADITMPISSPKFPTKKKVVRKTTNRLKVPKIPSTNRIIKKKIQIKTEVNCTETPNVLDNSKIDPTSKIRKSTRQQTPSKKLCNFLNDAVYRCKQCNYQSYYKQKYEVHLLHHTDDRPFPCMECPKKFFERWELNRHIRVNHSQNKIDAKTPMRRVKKEVKKPRNIMTNNDNNSWEVDSLPSFLEPAVSLIVNPGKVVTPIIQSIHSLAETSMQEDPIEMSFSCKICNISFKSRNLLMLHTQTHELKRTCEVCQEEFITEVDFLNHVCTHDTNKSIDLELELPPKLVNKKKKKKFFCNVCNMEFASRDHGNIHTGAKPYACKTCGKQFAAYTTLRKHNWTHQDRGESTKKRGKRQASPQRRTFSCEICKKKFVNKEYVYSHNCHNASGDSVYRCQICKNAFIGRAALIEHMGMHVSQNENGTE